jgi:hypothetical protein
MSLAVNITNLATRIATELKAHKTLINGNAVDLSSLTTTNKANLVAAHNEVKASIGASGAVIDDTTASTTKVYSSDKVTNLVAVAIADVIAASPSTLNTLDELAAALGDDPNFATTIATALGNRVRVDAVQTFTAGQKAQATANIGALSLVQSGDPETDFVTGFNSGLV